MAGENSILFLFNENDKNNNNNNIFLFGDVAPPACHYKIHPIDPSNNTINFDCGCIVIDNNNNDVILDCNPSDLVPVYFSNITTYFGYSSTSALSPDISAISYFGTYVTTSTLYVPDMRVNPVSYIGYESNSILLTIRQFAATSYFGIAADAFILYDPYTLLIPVEGSTSAHFGVSADALIIYDPYHLFFDTDEYAVSHFGYEAKNTQFVYDPYHLFFTEGENAASYFGYELKNKFIFNPYNELFADGEVGTFIYGQTSSTFVLFNPYNPFTTDVISYYGIDAAASIRYSDDPYISQDPINFDVGYSAITTIQYADVRADLNSNIYFGYSSNNVVMASPGFVSTSYIGYTSRIKYLIIGRQSAYFTNCVMTFGYELHNNIDKIRYFDLSNTECCSIKHYQLHHIEMTDKLDVGTIYGLDKGWGFSAHATLTYQPRFSATFTHGFSSEVVDNSVYLGLCTAYVGLSIHTRNISYSSSLDIGYGNFIIDQNEIKVELTKPDDVFAQNYAMTFGYHSKVLFGASYGLYPQPIGFGFNSVVTVAVEEALRGLFQFGYWGITHVSMDYKFSPTGHFGIRSYANFYEPPYIMGIGFNSTCSYIVTENFVELLEEGELDNDYIFQNENGDPILDRVTDSAIEGYPYFRYVKGRCF